MSPKLLLLLLLSFFLILMAFSTLANENSNRRQKRMKKPQQNKTAGAKKRKQSNSSEKNAQENAAVSHRLLQQRQFDQASTSQNQALEEHDKGEKMQQNQSPLLAVTPAEIQKMLTKIKWRGPRDPLDDGQQQQQQQQQQAETFGQKIQQNLNYGNSDVDFSRVDFEPLFIKHMIDEANEKPDDLELLHKIYKETVTNRLNQYERIVSIAMEHIQQNIKIEMDMEKILKTDKDGTEVNNFVRDNRGKFIGCGLLDFEGKLTEEVKHSFKNVSDPILVELDENKTQFPAWAVLYNRLSNLQFFAWLFGLLDTLLKELEFEPQDQSKERADNLGNFVHHLFEQLNTLLQHGDVANVAEILAWKKPPPQIKHAKTVNDGIAERVVDAIKKSKCEVKEEEEKEAY